MKLKFNNRNTLILERNNHSYRTIDKICDMVLRNLYGDDFHYDQSKIEFIQKIYKFVKQNELTEISHFTFNLPDKRKQEQFLDELYAFIVELKLTK